MAGSIPRFGPDRFTAVAIGSSTGGPQHVTHILAGLPADLRVPIFVAQHLPPSFTAFFSADLARQSPLTVMHAEHGMPVLAGVVYIGRGREHMRVRQHRDGRLALEISPEPARLLYRPSADELFSSVAKVFGRGALGVVLTGMGTDGAIGAVDIKQAGGMVLAQEPASCAVYGMPKACVEAGAVAASLTPEQIRLSLMQLSPRHGPSSAAG